MSLRDKGIGSFALFGQVIMSAAGAELASKMGTVCTGPEQTEARAGLPLVWCRGRPVSWYLMHCPGAAACRMPSALTLLELRCTQQPTQIGMLCMTDTFPHVSARSPVAASR